MMIEITVLQYLEETLQIPVYAEKPESPEPEYILIERTSGGYTNHICRATMAVQSYADSMLRAAQINEYVEKAMRDIISLTDISRCELNSSYNFTDISSKKYRYQAVFDIVYMEGD